MQANTLVAKKELPTVSLNKISSFISGCYILQLIIYLCRIYAYKQEVFVSGIVSEGANLLVLSVMFIYIIYCSKNFAESGTHQKVFYTLALGIGISYIVHMIITKISTEPLVSQLSWILTSFILASALLYIGFILKDTLFKAVSIVFLAIQAMALLLPTIEFVTASELVINFKVWDIVRIIAFVASLFILRGRLVKTTENS